MTTKHIKTKDALLGMKYTTAVGGLQRRLLFKFAGDLGLLSCFRCGESICTIKEFTVEHKKIWSIQESPLESFFDLGNIAFSHYRCNSGATVQPNKKYANRKEKEAAKYRRKMNNPDRREELLRRKRDYYTKVREIALQGRQVVLKTMPWC